MEKIRVIAEEIEKAGGRLYLVGGAVRDLLLGHSIQDRDFCITGLTTEEFQSLFPKATMRGKSFGVFAMGKDEFALARTEKKNGVGHKAFSIENDKSVSIQEDLRRRDVTINSMAQDILTGELIDPFNGRRDLDNKVIRATGASFSEDPLRSYRVARFAATLQFTVEQETLQKMKQTKSELMALPRERVFLEFQKALKAQKPSTFLQVLREANLLEVHFKEIEQLIGSLQPAKYHPEGDSYQHTLLVVDKAAQLTQEVRVRFSALVHDLGKGITPKEMYPHHYGHDEKGVKVVEEFCKRIGVPKSWELCGKASSFYHMKGGIFGKMTPNKQVDFIQNVSKTILGLDGLQIVVTADKCSTRDCIEQEISFAKLGKEMLKQETGKKIIEQFPTLTGPEIGRKLREKRIEWIKQNGKGYCM